MTATTLPRTEAEQTPESQDLARLEAMLNDPDLAGFHDDIRKSITELRAKSVLGA